MQLKELEKWLKKKRKKENVEPLRSDREINEFLFCLRRTRYPERDVFLFQLGINTGLRMSISFL